MNIYLSNLAVMNAKLHNLHWNIVGINFVPIHNFTESLYDEAFEAFDAVAEHLKMENAMPLSKLSDYIKHATIEEIDAKEFSTGEVLKILLEDLTAMQALAKEIREIADENNDPIAVAMFEDYMAGYKKHLWFLNSMNK